MSKLFKKMNGLILVLMMMFTVINANVSANSNKVTTGSGISGSGVRVTWKENTSFYWNAGVSGYPAIYVNGNVAYCIEPLVSGVVTNVASSKPLSEVNQLRVMAGYPQRYNLSDSQERKITLIANYGYGYEGHNTNNYQWATQKLIWNELGFEVTGGNNVNTEMNNIMKLVNSHDEKPSWNNTTKKVKIGDTVDLSHATISSFNVYQSTDLEVVSHNNNTLKVKITGNNPKLLMKKKQGIKDGTSLVFTDGQSQAVGQFKLSDPIIATINFEIASGNIELEKVDENGKNVAGVEFAISKNSNMNTVLKKAKTNAQGKVSFTDLDEGTYYYQEVSVPSPLVIDKTIKSIVVNGGETAKAKVTNKIAKGNVQVIKQNTANQKVQGAKFNVLNSSGAVVDTLTTNSSGTATSKTLPLGNYSLVETFVPAPYILDSKPIPFALTYKDQNTPIVSVSKTQTNEIVKGKVEIVKKESAVNNPEYIDQKLANAVFELRAKNEIKEFGKVVYSAGDLVATLTTDKNGKAVKDNLPLGEYTLKETKAPQGYLLDDTVHTLSINYKDQNTAVVSVGKTLENKVIKGKIQVVKTDRTSLLTKGLPNAIFGVYKADTDEKVDEITTDKNGFAYTKELRYGNYYLQELKAPIGYWLDSTKYPVSINNHDVIEVQHVGNDMIQAKIKVVKTDSDTDLPIENVEFKILDENNDVVSIKFQEGNEVKTQDTFITDENGVFILQAYLPYGTYKLVETKAPEQYLPIDPIEFTIDENQDYIDLEVIGLTLPMEIENDWKKGNIEIAKVDLHSGEPIADTVFELYDSEFNLIDTLTTDENGKVQVDDLKYGMYYIKEIEVPFPYVINSEKELQNIFVQENGKTYTVTFENVKTEINIFKVDKETGEPIADTVFELYNEDKELLETLTTDETGVVTVEGLELGKYFVKEIKVPAPYVINPKNELQELELTEENNSYDIKFENEKAVGKITVIKTDDFDEVVGNAEFTLYDEDMNVIEVATTDENGLIIFDTLPLGNYIVKETKAPQGYDLNDQEFNVELTFKDQNTPIIESVVEVENKRTEVDIIVKKVDKTTKEILKDAEFTLYDEDMNVVEVATTDENGIARFTVTFGNYKLKETKAPQGYLLSEEIIDIEIKGNEENLEYVIEFDNEIMPTELAQTGVGSNLPMLVTSGSLIMVGLYLLFKNKRDENEEGL